MTQQGMLWPNHDISGRNVALANQLRACDVCIQRVPWYVVVRPGYTMLSRLPFFFPLDNQGKKARFARAPHYKLKTVPPRHILPILVGVVDILAQLDQET